MLYLFTYFLKSFFLLKHESVFSTSSARAVPTSEGITLGRIMAADDAARSAARKLDFAHHEHSAEDQNTPADGVKTAEDGLQVWQSVCHSRSRNSEFSIFLYQCIRRLLIGAECLFEMSFLAN
jgi:hypothetical protein